MQSITPFRCDMYNHLLRYWDDLSGGAWRAMSHYPWSWLYRTFFRSTFKLVRYVFIQCIMLTILYVLQSTTKSKDLKNEHISSKDTISIWHRLYRHIRRKQTLRHQFENFWQILEDRQQIIFISRCWRNPSAPRCKIFRKTGSLPKNLGQGWQQGMWTSDRLPPGVIFTARLLDAGTVLAI